MLYGIYSTVYLSLRRRLEERASRQANISPTNPFSVTLTSVHVRYLPRNMCGAAEENHKTIWDCR
jgi:hypothetical protein